MLDTKICQAMKMIDDDDDKLNIETSKKIIYNFPLF
jgi:hypothetical protein